MRSTVLLRHPFLLFSCLVLRLIPWTTCDAASHRSRTKSNANARNIAILNESGVKIDVFWIHPTTKELADSAIGGGIMYGGSSGINSFIGHSFEVQEIPSKKGCLYPTCRKAYFTVTSDEDQVFTIEKDFSVTIENHRTKALKVAQDAIKSCQRDTTLPPMQQLEAYASCLSQQINATLEAKKEEIDFEKSVRKRMGDAMSTYACEDVYLNTSSSIRNTSWTYKEESSASGDATTTKRLRNEAHRVQVLFESDANQIMLIENFFTPSQCQQLIEASVAVDDETGTSNKNVHQRVVPLSAKSHVGHLLAKMYQLVLAYTSTSLEYDNDPMLTLQIRQAVSPPTPATDNECAVTETGESTGACASSSSSRTDTELKLQRIDPNVVAQVRIVCSTTDDLLGGSVHYPKAGVHVNPMVNMTGHALLTLFQHSKTGQREIDPFVEEYVECNVQQGQVVSIVQDFVSNSKQ